MICLLLLCGQVLAQSRVVSGRVTDQAGEPVPNASIVLKGTSTGVLSDNDGRYSITVSSNSTVIVITAIGFASQEIAVGNKNTVDPVLIIGDKALEEIVVTAYGSQKKSDFTGSASTVKAAVLENRPVTSFEKALQGQATGVTVQSSSGQPGAQSTVRIRGVGSMGTTTTATNASAPLYVLDGVAITTGDFTQATQTADVLSTLDPRDIESVTVLKDATAAGLYGSRAANGVIVITTKKGKAGKSAINFVANQGFSSIAVERHKLLSSEQYFKYWWDNYYNTAIAGGSTPEAAATTANNSTRTALQANPFNNDQPYNANGQLNAGTNLVYDTDWRDAILNQGQTQDFSLSVSGGTDKTKFYLSGGYFNQKGVVLSSNFKRYSAKINLENNTTSFLKIGINTTLSYTDQNTPAGAGGAANPIRFSEIVASVYPLYQLDADKQPLPDPSGGYLYNYRTPVVFDYNPVGLAKKNLYTVQTARAIISGFAEVSFTKDLKFRSTGTVDYIDISETRYYNPLNGDGSGVKGRTNKYRPRDLALTITNLLSYGKNFGEHAVDVLVGQEAIKFEYQNIYAGGTGFPFDGIYELSAASTPVDAFSNTTEKRISSWFSRANYHYGERYYLTGSVRRDGSSVFGADKRYGTFWTVGGGWRIGKESFLRGAEWLDELKLKASYGTSGNDNIARYARLGLYGIYSYNGLPASSYKQLANASLQWESNKVTDIGLEISVLNRFRAELGYFSRISKDVLFDEPVSFLTGFSTLNTNLATIKNSGFEGLLEVGIIKNKNFNWTSSLNVTTLKNVIQHLNDSVVLNGSTHVFRIGKDRYQWFIRDWAGVDPTDGSPTWYQDEIVGGVATGKRITTKSWNSATRYDVGSALPKFYGGFNNNFSYKSFDLAILTFFSVGGKIYDAYEAQLLHMGAIRGQQLTAAVYDAWQKPGDVTDVPRFSDRNTFLFHNSSTRFLYDGSYVRLKNVALGYRIPTSVLGRINITSARIYVSGENLATWASHKGMDPEVAISGLPNNEIPIIKTITVGLNIGL